MKNLLLQVIKHLEMIGYPYGRIKFSLDFKSSQMNIKWIKKAKIKKGEKNLQKYN